MALFPVKPKVSKMYDGRGVATRPLPVDTTDSGMNRAIAAASLEQQPKAAAVNMPSAPRVAGADAVFGTPVAGSAKIRAGIYAPATGQEGTV